MKRKEVMNGMKRTAAVVIVCFLGIIALIPEAVLAGTSNEQVIGGSPPDPGNGVKAKHPSIDSIGNNLIAVFSQEVTVNGKWNIYAAKSLNGGASWSNPVRICQSDNNQTFPDVVLLHEQLYGPTSVYIVWQEGDGPWLIKTKAVYFSDLNNGFEPYGAGGIYTIMDSSGNYQYPRISGTVQTWHSSAVNIQIVWQSDDNSNSVIEMIDYARLRQPMWGNRQYLFSCEDNEFFNPSISAAPLDHYDDSFELWRPNAETIVAVTCDMMDDMGSYSVVFKRIIISQSGVILNISNIKILNYDSQSNPFFPDVSVTDSDWGETLRKSFIYIAAQVIISDPYNDEYYIKIFANDYGGDHNNWNGPYTAGTSSTPSRRGVALDVSYYDYYTKVIWAVSNGLVTEVRTDFFIYDSNSGFIRHSEEPNPWDFVDTPGLFDGPIAYVAISFGSYSWDSYNFHCLYNLCSMAIVYYTWTYDEF